MGIVTKNSILLVDYAIMNHQASRCMRRRWKRGGAVAAKARIAGNWRRFANSPPDGDGGNWRLDDFLAADSGGDSGGFYLHGRFANLDF